MKQYMFDIFSVEEDVCDANSYPEEGVNLYGVYEASDETEALEMFKKDKPNKKDEYGKTEFFAVKAPREYKVIDEEWTAIY